MEGGQGGDPAGVFGGGQQGAVGIEAQAQAAPAGVGGERPKIGAEQRLAAGKGNGEGAEGGHLVNQGERLAGGEFGVGSGAVVGAGHGEEAVAAAFVAAVGQFPVDAEQPPLLACLGQQARQEGIGRAAEATPARQPESGTVSGWVPSAAGTSRLRQYCRQHGSGCRRAR